MLLLISSKLMKLIYQYYKDKYLLYKIINKVMNKLLYKIQIQLLILTVKQLLMKVIYNKHKVILLQLNNMMYKTLKIFL